MRKLCTGVVFFILLFGTGTAKADLLLIPGVTERSAPPQQQRSTGQAGLEPATTTNLLGLSRYSCPGRDGFLDPTCRENLFPPCSETLRVALTTDFYVALWIGIDEAQDGDTWTWTAYTPTGPHAASATMRFYENYGGQQQCFVLQLDFFRTVVWCGASSMNAAIGFLVQDGPPGPWQIDLTHNGQLLFSEPFELVKPPILTFKAFSESQLASGILGVTVDLSVSAQDAGSCTTHVRVGTSPTSLSEGVDVNLEAGTQEFKIYLNQHGIDRFDDDVILSIETKTSGACASIPHTLASTTLGIPLPVVFIHGYVPPNWLGRLIARTFALGPQADHLFKFLSDASQPGGDFVFATSDYRIPYKEEPPYKTLWFARWDNNFDAAPSDAANRIRNVIDQALEPVSIYASRVNLITHSAGGLLARYDITRGAPVRKLIMVGCPNHGMSLAYTKTSGYRWSDFDELRKGVGGLLIPRNRADACSLSGHQQLYLKQAPCAPIVDPPPFQSTFIPFDQPFPSDVVVTNIYARVLDAKGNIEAKTSWDLIATPKRFRDNSADNWYTFEDRKTSVAQSCCPGTDWQAKRAGDGWVAVSDAELEYASVTNRLVSTRENHVFLMSQEVVRQEILVALGLVKKPTLALPQEASQHLYGGNAQADILLYPEGTNDVDHAPAGSKVVGIGNLSSTPNPFIGSTTISVEKEAGLAGGSIEIFDVNGGLVRRIPLVHVNSERQYVTWDGKGDDGARLPSGVYFCTVTAGDFVATRKMVLLR